jgi:hypothetical protein
MRPDSHRLAETRRHERVRPGFGEAHHAAPGERGHVGAPLEVRRRHRRALGGTAEQPHALGPVVVEGGEDRVDLRGAAPLGEQRAPRQLQRITQRRGHGAVVRQVAHPLRRQLVPEEPLERVRVDVGQPGVRADHPVERAADLVVVDHGCWMLDLIEVAR